MKPFDLEAAKAGTPVQTREGRPVRLLCFDADSIYPIVGLIKHSDQEVAGSWTVFGERLEGVSSSADDLFMAPVKMEKWVNVYPEKNCCGGNLYNSKKDALKGSMWGERTSFQVKVEWEE